jgi:hypothetical protein
MEALSCGPGLTYSEALSYTQWLAAQHDSPHQRVRGRGHCCHRDPVYYLTRTKILESIGGIVGYSGVEKKLRALTLRSATALTNVYEVEGSAVTARFLGGFVYAVVNTWPSYTYALLALLRLRIRCCQHLALVHVRTTWPS